MNHDLEQAPDEMPTTRQALEAIRDHIKATGSMEGASAWGLTGDQEAVVLNLWAKHSTKLADKLDQYLSSDEEVWFILGVRFHLFRGPWSEPPAIH